MLRSLLRMSWRSLIVEAVADLRPLFTRRFLRELEPTSPFRLRFLRKRHKRLTRRRGMYESLFDVLIEDHDEEPARLPLPERLSQISKTRSGAPVIVSEPSSMM